MYYFTIMQIDAINNNALWKDQTERKIVTFEKHANLLLLGVYFVILVSNIAFYTFFLFYFMNRFQSF